MLFAELEPVSEAELQAGLEHIRHAPGDAGLVELIVARPRSGKRRVLEVGELSVEDGLVGDSWRVRRRAGGTKPPNPEMQLTLMNSRVTALVARERARWPLAGDQLLVDLDLSTKNLPPGSVLEVGDALVQVSAVPHTGCKKFVERFGLAAMEFVNSPLGRELNLRGINARVVRGGTIRSGGAIRKYVAG